jgi:hypothetical protein
MSAPASEHWFDRWATPRTRRHVLATGFAAAASLTFPVARSSATRAAGPHDCMKGCLWTANRVAQAAMDQCVSTEYKAFELGGLMAIWGAGLFTADIVGAGALPGTFACFDRAALDQKAANWDCTLPDCPGFDPTGPDGPCIGCVTTGANCCPCPSTTTGYICCPYPCDDPDHNCCPA